MTITTFIAVVIAVALGIALAPHVRGVLTFLLGLVWWFFALGGAVAAVALLLAALLWRDAVRELGLGYWYFVAIGIPLGISLSAFKVREWYSHRCPVCKQTLFVGEADPMDHYLAGNGG